MVRLRLRRMGLKGQPTYRIVAADQRSPREGRFLEIIGFYNPRTQPSTEIINEERVIHWLSNGAQPTEAVEGILRRAGTLERYERFKKGEALDVLLAEAEAARAAAPAVSPRTRYPSPAAGEGKAKFKKAE